MNGSNEDDAGGRAEGTRRLGTRGEVRERHLRELRAAESRKLLGELSALGIEHPEPDPTREAQVRTLAVAAFAAAATVSTQALLWESSIVARVLCLVAAPALVAALWAATLVTATSLRRLWRPVAVIWAATWCVAASCALGLPVAPAERIVLGAPLLAASFLAAGVAFFAAWLLGHHVHAAADARRTNVRIAATRASVERRLERLT